jgi:hypothetical protein
VKNYYLLVGFDKRAGKPTFLRLPSMPSGFGMMNSDSTPADLPPDLRTFPFWIFEMEDKRVHMLGLYLHEMPTGETLEEFNRRALDFLESAYPDKKHFKDG